MRHTHRRLTRLAFTLYGVGLGASLGAQPIGAPPGRSGPPRPTAALVVESRWQPSFDAFAAADRRQQPQPGVVLFVGSSSIRLWDGLEQQFEGRAVLNRGFGGSRMADVAAHVEQLVLPYRPALIVVYAGDNDLAEGSTPEQVLDSFTQFVERVRSALPDARIAYLSIKPSPLRAALMPQAARTNAMIARYCAATPELNFIDIYSRMLDEAGQPRRELYGADALHLSAMGYALWQQTIAPYLTAPRAGPLNAAVVSTATAARH